MFNSVKSWFSALSTPARISVIAAVVIAGGVTSAAVNPSCNEPITYSTKTENVSTLFDTISTKDPTMNVGETKVTKTGVHGTDKVTYKIGTQCNKEVSKQSINTVVISKPVSQEQLVGDKEVTSETQDVVIPFTNQNVNDNTMDQGTSKIVQAGVNGSKKVIYEVIKIDGQERSRTQKSEEITLQPVPQITHIGTKPQPSCDPNYSPCIPYYSGNALNCGDIGIEVRVIGVDHNRFDADGDGYGCESYR